MIKTVRMENGMSTRALQKRDIERAIINSAFQGFLLTARNLNSTRNDISTIEVTGSTSKVGNASAIQSLYTFYQHLS